FSSRRRHTRFSRDWSSDVCSSDLNQLNHKNLVEEAYFIDPISGIKISKFYEGSRIIDATNNEELRALMVQLRKLHEGDYQFKERSEERRVGKECRTGWKK